MLRQRIFYHHPGSSSRVFAPIFFFRENGFAPRICVTDKSPKNIPKDRRRIENRRGTLLISFRLGSSEHFLIFLLLLSSPFFPWRFYLFIYSNEINSPLLSSFRVNFFFFLFHEFNGVFENRSFPFTTTFKLDVFTMIYWTCRDLYSDSY